MSLLVTFFIVKSFERSLDLQKLPIQNNRELSLLFYLQLLIKSYKLKFKKIRKKWKMRPDIWNRPVYMKRGLAIWNRPGYMKLEKSRKKSKKGRKWSKNVKKGSIYVKPSKKGLKVGKVQKRTFVEGKNVEKGRKTSLFDEKFLICQISPTRRILSDENRPSKKGSSFP